MAKQFPYPRRFRLRSEKEFQSLFQSGKRFRGRGVNILYRFHNAHETPCKCGVVVGKKLGNAVLRNRFKRLGRDTLRHRYPKFPGNLDLVLEVLPKSRNETDEGIRQAMEGAVDGFLELLT